MSDSTDERVRLDAIIAQYRAELVRLNYVRGSINVYLRSIRRLFQLMEEQGVALGDLTPDVAAELVDRASWLCDRQQYAIFIAKRFVEYLSARGMAKLPVPSTPAETVRIGLRRDYELSSSPAGLSNKTIASCWYVADRFLTFRFGDKGQTTTGEGALRSDVGSWCLPAIRSARLRCALSEIAPAACKAWRTLTHQPKSLGEHRHRRLWTSPY